jgi:hypothetical protein
MESTVLNANSYANITVDHDILLGCNEKLNFFFDFKLDLPAICSVNQSKQSIISNIEYNEVFVMGINRACDCQIIQSSSLQLILLIPSSIFTTYQTALEKKSKSKLMNFNHSSNPNPLWAACIWELRLVIVENNPNQDTGENNQGENEIKSEITTNEKIAVCSRWTDGLFAPHNWHSLALSLHVDIDMDNNMNKKGVSGLYIDGNSKMNLQSNTPAEDGEGIILAWLPEKIVSEGINHFYYSI